MVAAIGARIFGMSFNRIFDRRLDALNPRTAGRELPAGRLTLRTALAIAIGGLLVYLAACVALGGWCLVLAPLPLVPLLGYSLLKRFTALCHFGIGLCLALAPLGAFVATTGNPNFTPPAVFFSFFVFCWLSGSDIVYALIDLESDRKTGVHSLPVWLGADGALLIAGLLHAVAFGCLTAVFFLTGGRGPAALALALVVLRGARVKQQLITFDQTVSQTKLTMIADKLNAAYRGLTRSQILGKELALSTTEQKITDCLAKIMEAEDELEYEEPYLNGVHFMLSQPEFIFEECARPNKTLIGRIVANGPMPFKST